MRSYRVLFYKTLANSTGHCSKCLEQQIDLDADTPSQALVLAEGRVDERLVDTDCIEVVLLSGNGRPRVSGAQTALHI